MMKVEPNPYHKVIACPSKLYIMDQLHRHGRIGIENIINDKNIFRPSIERHIRELLSDKLVDRHDHDFLIITNEGEKVVRYIDGGKESLRALSS